MVGSRLTASISALVVFQAKRVDPNLSSWVASGIRVLLNPLFSLPLFFSLQKHRGRSVPWELVAWGALGAMTVGSYYWSLVRLNPGEVAFLYGSHPVFMAALGPLFLGVANAKGTVFSLLLCLVGLALIVIGPSAFASVEGRIGMLFSSFCAGVAYLMVARLRGRVGPSGIMLAWFLGSIILHAVVFWQLSPTLPTSGGLWALLIVAGFLAALSQYLISIAYQNGATDSMATLSFLTPVFSLVLDVLIYRHWPSAFVGAGTAAILIACLCVAHQKSPADLLRRVFSVFASP